MKAYDLSFRPAHGDLVKFQQHAGMKVAEREGYVIKVWGDQKHGTMLNLSVNNGGLTSVPESSVIGVVKAAPRS